MCTRYLIMNELREEILNRVNDAIRNTQIDCPDCENMYSDDQYTCTTCWCEGGQGKLDITDYIEIKK